MPREMRPNVIMAHSTHLSLKRSHMSFFALISLKTMSFANIAQKIILSTVTSTSSPLTLTLSATSLGHMVGIGLMKAMKKTRKNYRSGKTKELSSI